MRWILTCPSGHSWEPDGKEARIDQLMRCPTCGLRAGGSRELPPIHEPPQPDLPPASAVNVAMPSDAFRPPSQLLRPIEERRQIWPPSATADAPSVPPEQSEQWRFYLAPSIAAIIVCLTLLLIFLSLANRPAESSPQKRASFNDRSSASAGAPAIAPAAAAAPTQPAENSALQPPPPAQANELKLNDEELALQKKETDLRSREEELQRREEEFKQRQLAAALATPALNPVPQFAVPPALGSPPRSMVNLDDQRVVDAMHRGANALLAAIQNAAGPNNPGGGPNTQGRGRISPQAYDDGELTLAVYALLIVDRALDEPKFHFTSQDMAPFVQHVADLQTDRTYVLALQANALALLPKRPEYVTALKVVRTQLMMNTHVDGSYGYGRPSSWSDNSNSQYGLLGMWACDDAGAEVPVRFWVAADSWWRHHQQTDGGWGYRPTSRDSTDTMTTAGIASLFVTKDKLMTGAPMVPSIDYNVNSGLQWLISYFDQNHAFIGDNLYLAYGIERVGLASGLKYFGKRDWYRDGISSVLAAQTPDALWYYNRDDAQGIVGTSYALLFLARGRFPVVFNKLQYPGPWNARPSDAAHFTRWLSKKTERDLNWQIVDIATNPDDWLDAPILLITGHGDPSFTDEQIAKLRHFTEAGGLIFSTADGNDKAFTDAIRHKYAPAIVSNQYEMRELPADHYLFTLDYKPPKGDVPVMYGLSNGIRELWIHSPTDMGAEWQRYAIAAQDNWEIPANLYFYVSGRASLRSKLQPLSVPDDNSAPVQTWNLAQVTYAGNSDPEPAAWPRFCRIVKLNHQTKIELDQVPLDQLDPRKNPIAHITGTASFTLSDAQQTTLRNYLQGGGILIADAAGGSEAFGGAFKAAISKVLPNAPFLPVDPNTHPVITGQFAGGERLTDAEPRHFCLTEDNRARSLDLYELDLNGRPAVLFFDADITCGLLGTNTWGIFGYTPATCESLAWNALAYANASAAPGVKKE